MRRCRNRAPLDSKTFVLDTNVLLHDPEALNAFEENDIVIPLVVIEEGRLVSNGNFESTALAWVGIKDSGRGCSLSSLGYAQLTRPKSFYSRALG